MYKNTQASITEDWMQVLVNMIRLGVTKRSMKNEHLKEWISEGWVHLLVYWKRLKSHCKMYVEQKLNYISLWGLNATFGEYKNFKWSQENAWRRNAVEESYV